MALISSRMISRGGPNALKEQMGRVWAGRGGGSHPIRPVRSVFTWHAPAHSRPPGFLLSHLIGSSANELGIWDFKNSLARASSQSAGFSAEVVLACPPAKNLTLVDPMLPHSQAGQNTDTREQLYNVNPNVGVVGGDVHRGSSTNLRTLLERL